MTTTAHGSTPAHVPVADATAERAATFPGIGKLGAWENLKEDVVRKLALAYHAVGQGRDENYVLWRGARQAVRDAAVLNLNTRSLEAAPLYADALMRRLAPTIPSPKPTEHLAYVEAFFTDYNERFALHCEYRLATAGNVHLEITGKTGFGKSSGALAIADWLDTIPPEDVEQHVNFDLGELPTRLRGKRPRQTVIQDEFIAVSGEGANTTRMLFTNLEDTLRGSQVNLFVLSPRRQEHGTMQAVLEAVVWNPTERYTVFMVWVDDQPHGIISVPWANDPLWKTYSIFKARNVQRTMTAQFNDVTKHMRTAVRLLDEPRVQWWLCDVIAKPKKGDFEDAIRLGSGQMMTVTERSFVAEMMYAAARAYDKVGGRLEEQFGVTPTEGLKRVARAIGKKA